MYMFFRYSFLARVSGSGTLSAAGGGRFPIQLLTEKNEPGESEYSTNHSGTNGNLLSTARGLIGWFPKPSVGGAKVQEFFGN